MNAVENEIVISVIVPARNSAEYLEKCLSSLFNQSLYSSFYEIILVDNCSVDETLSIAKTFDVKIITSEAKNAAGVRNDGAKVANGEILAFLDSDCVAPYSWLELIKSSLSCERSPLVYGGTCLTPIDGTFVEKSWAPGTTYYEGHVISLPGANMALKKDLFLSLGGFREELSSAEDDDLCKRVHSEGGEVFSKREMAVIHLGYPKTFLELFKKNITHGESQLKAHGYFGDKVVVITWLWLIGFLILPISIIFIDSLFLTALFFFFIPPILFSIARLQRASLKVAITSFFKTFIVSFVALFGRCVGLIREVRTSLKY